MQTIYETKPQLISTVRSIVKNEGTPFYFFDSQQFEDNIRSFTHELSKYSPRNIVGYSFKTNYTPSICAAARDLGCYAEVVSRVELELAQKLQFENGKTVFNGPVKTADDIALAISMGAIINFDHLEQLESLASLPMSTRKNVRAGLRINIDLNQKLLAKKIAKGGLLPRFGMNQSLVKESLSHLRQLSVDVVALHGHCSSSDRSPENYSEIVAEMLRIRDHFQLDNVDYFDVGGGFSGRQPSIWNLTNAPTFADYAAAIFRPLLEDSWYQSHQPMLVIEPGMSVVADSVGLTTRIISRKKLGNDTVLGVDANFYNVRPTYHNKPLTYSIVHDASRQASTDVVKVRAVFGGTCMERDILLEDIELVDPQVGDSLIIEDVGAYCSVLTPNFINYQPPIYNIHSDHSYSTAREKQTFDGFFTGFNL